MKGNRCIRQITAVIFKSMIFFTQNSSAHGKLWKKQVDGSARAGVYQVGKALSWGVGGGASRD